MGCMGLKILCLGVFCFVMVLADDDEQCFKADFSEIVTGCDDFTNSDVTLDDFSITPVKRSESSEDDDSTMGLSGNITLHLDLADDHKIKLKISKITETGEELMWQSMMSVCEALKDDKAPWWPVVEAMNLESCPVSEALYPVKDMVLSLDCCKSVLTEDNVGEYIIQFQILERVDMISCYMLQVSISETKC